jgi:hypothetical protein
MKLLNDKENYNAGLGRKDNLFSHRLSKDAHSIAATSSLFDKKGRFYSPRVQKSKPFDSISNPHIGLVSM